MCTFQRPSACSLYAILVRNVSGKIALWLGLYRLGLASYSRKLVQSLTTELAESSSHDFAGGWWRMAGPWYNENLITYLIELNHEIMKEHKN